MAICEEKWKNEKNHKTSVAYVTCVAYVTASIFAYHEQPKANKTSKF